MKVDSRKGFKSMQDALRRLEDKEGSSVAVGSIRNPALKELARTVQTACSSSVSIARMKETLKTVGANIRGADANSDGRLDAREQRALSALSQRLLELATGTRIDPEPTPSRPVSTGCGASTPVTRPVSTGCGAATPARPDPAPARPTPPPSRPVSTGCGSAGPVITPRPIRTGC